MDAQAVVAQLRAAGRLHRAEAVPDSAELNAAFDRFLGAMDGEYSQAVLQGLSDSRRRFFDGTHDAFGDIARGLHQRLVDSLDPGDLRTRLSDSSRYAVAVERLDSFNATSFAVGDAWLTLIDRKLLQVLYVTARTISGRINRAPVQISCEVCEDSTCREVSAAITARRWFETGWRAQHGSRQIIEHWTPRGDQLINATELATHAEMFVMAHEIGHHIAGHTTTGSNIEATGSLQEFFPSWWMEVEADRVGTSLLIDRAAGQAPVTESGLLDGSGFVLVAMGIEHFFSTTELLSRLADPDQGPTTHPPVPARRDIVDLVYSRQLELEPLRQVARDVRSFYGILWETLASPSEHAMGAYVRELELAHTEARDAFAQVAQHGPDHIAIVAPPLNVRRAASSQLLFDHAVYRLAHDPGLAGQAARFYFETFCDTPPEIAGVINPRAPFLGLAAHVAAEGAFKDSQASSVRVDETSRRGSAGAVRRRWVRRRRP